jgi:effector-binding domain-containing protein
MLDLPEIIPTDELHTAVIHITIPREEIQSVMEPAIKEILAALNAQGIHPSGSLFSYHLKRPSDIFDFEVGFPVNAIVSPNGRVKAGKLPAARVVRANHHGGYEELGAAWGKLFSWIATNELKVQDSLWECYKIGPESSPDPANWVTELNSPLT